MRARLADALAWVKDLLILPWLLLELAFYAWSEERKQRAAATPGSPQNPIVVRLTPREARSLDEAAREGMASIYDREPGRAALKQLEDALGPQSPWPR